MLVTLKETRTFFDRRPTLIPRLAGTIFARLPHQITQRRPFRHSLSGISLCPVTAKMDPRYLPAGMTKKMCHFRHSQSGIHPGVFQMDPCYLTEGMTEGGWRLTCFWEIKWKRPLFRRVFYKILLSGLKVLITCLKGDNYPLTN